MQPGQIAEMAEDIFSFKNDKGKPPKQYCRRWEKCKVIAVHDKVLILERVNGDRFPARIDQISLPC